MRGKLAKALRKQAYGDMSMKVEPEYIEGINWGRVNIGLRQDYLKLKKVSLRTRRGY